VELQLRSVGPKWIDAFLNGKQGCLPHGTVAKASSLRLPSAFDALLIAGGLPR
jgi:hypothetical protein